jgi:predicted metalloendopeptidase
MMRSNGPLANVAAFYTTFGPEERDGMWLPPDRRVKIW